jgi:hypothetical protein
MTAAKFDLEAALADPAAAFAKPKDVVAHQGLSREAKIKLLRQWERDAMELSTSEYEGMVGGEENMLGRVLHALDTLNASGEKPKQTTGTTRGEP